MRVYISGPMTGLPDLNREAFSDAARQITASGHEASNPHDRETKGLWWERYLRLEIVELMKCDALVMLPGWRSSRGASLEVHLAASLGMPHSDLSTFVAFVGAGVR